MFADILPHVAAGALVDSAHICPLPLQGEVAFLLATDVAARGLDILGVEAVLNYDAPSSLASYLHRIGRTARAGRNGRAVTFIEDSDRALVKEVCTTVGQDAFRCVLGDFLNTHVLSVQVIQAKRHLVFCMGQCSSMWVPVQLVQAKIVCGIA